jgi:uncharacterized membrane protein YedE/YeeE
MKPATIISVLAAGVLFGFGLSYSTMIRPEVVLDFLLFRDLGLLLVLGGGALVALVAYSLVPRMLRAPLFAAAFQKHAAALNSRTIGGAALFGIGWGISGVCPGPAIAGLGAGNWPLLWAVGGIAAGAWVQGRWAGKG